MAEWLREPTLGDVQHYHDIVEAVSAYYGPEHAQSLVIWLNGFVPDFVSKEDAHE
jgi:hypothetical protein